MIAPNPGSKKKPATAKRHDPTKPWKPSRVQLKWWRQWTEENLSPREIARRNKSGESEEAVWLCLQKIANWQQQQNIDLVNAYRSRQVQQYEMVQQQTWESWVNSHGKSVVVTIFECSDEESPPRTKKTTQIKYSHGDTAYLVQYFAAMAKIAELLGLKAPSKPEVPAQHPNEIEGLPDPQNFATREEAIIATNEALRAMSERQRARAEIAAGQHRA